MEESKTENSDIVQLQGGLFRIGNKYLARDGFNVIAAQQLLDDGKPITVAEFAKAFGLGNSKLGRRKAKRWIQRFARHQYATERPIIGTYEIANDGTPLPNGRLIQIQMFSGNGSVEERQALESLKNKKEYLGQKLLGEARHIQELQTKIAA